MSASTSLTSAQMKNVVGRHAARHVFDKLVLPGGGEGIVGIGTGSTADEFTRALHDIANSRGMKLAVVTSSRSSTELCKGLGLRVLEFSYRKDAVVYVDGCDELTIATTELGGTDLNTIKGGGGALTREVLAGSFAKKRIVILDETKVVKCLAQRFPLPIEVHPDAVEDLQAFLRQIGASFSTRSGGKALYGNVYTENSFFILDANFPSGADRGIARAIKSIPGVLGTGLFDRFFDIAMVCHTDGRVSEFQATGKVSRPFTWCD